MLDRPSDLSAEAQASFDEFAEDVRQRTLDQVEAMLLEVEPSLGQLTYDLAFQVSDALPRRSRRPQRRPAVLAVAIADAVGLDADETDDLLAYTVAIQEYFDILDDLVDGDVADGREREALLVTQVLLPLATGRLSRLGTDVVAYWSERALELVAAPHAETSEAPTAEAYREIVRHQSPLYGFVTGAAAIAAGSGDEDVERAEAVGRLLYQHAQFTLDYEQYVRGDDGAGDWNAAALVDPDGVREQLVDWRDEIEELTHEYPDPAGRRLRALVALDVDGWTDELDSS